MTDKSFIVFTYYTEHAFWKSIHTSECSELTEVSESADNYEKFFNEEFTTYEEAKKSVSGFPSEYCQCEKCGFN